MKARVEKINKDIPEPSSPKEDEQILSERLTKIKEQIKKDKEKGKKKKDTKEETLKSAKEIWDKIILSYEGDTQVKRAKLQTLRIQYETLQMHSDGSIANYFLRIDEIVNYMKNLGEEIKEVVLVEKALRSLSAKFEPKVFAIEEKQHLQNIIMTQLHEILTAFEMRKEDRQI
eukprot:PITA_31483